MTTHTVAQLISELAKHPNVRASADGSGFIVRTCDDEHAIKIQGVGDEFIVFAEEWHEHFDGAEEVLTFVRGLLSGTIEVAVKFRGPTPVGHQVHALEGGVRRVVSASGCLLSPFWRKKTIRILRYASPEAG